ncbi:hypothetical protein AX17_007406 [Amanita inopinata Kibby_2008]|nr:hypothetical protein AX17_007406 [Amanita inopinata Kibby_2008]
MQIQRLIGAILYASSVFLLAAASAEDAVEPNVVATAAFPESNAFGFVVNGEKNSMTVTVANKSGREMVLVSVAGSLHHPETDALVKNLTAMNFGFPLIDNVTLNIPYAFYSEFKPGDVRLNLWLEHSVDGVKYRIPAYDSIVKVVEPEKSLFDVKMLTTYLIVFGILGGFSYYAYVNLIPQPKKSRSKPASSISAPVGSVTATGAGGYQEEWIPEHHLRKNKSGKKQGNATSGTSADEQSGAETSGTDGRRRKGKK